jgi:hypothetical protein
MAGEYSLWILPTATTWTLIFNSEAHISHAPRLVAGRREDPAAKHRSQRRSSNSPLRSRRARRAPWQHRHDMGATRVAAPFVVVK